MAGTKAEAANENEAATSGRMSAGLSEATMAATSATASSANFDKITRCSGVTWWLISCEYTSRTIALLMVSSSPSAVDRAAAKPPAATRPETT